jgi:RNA polymerase sigma factor (sigma-70 family)
MNLFSKVGSDIDDATLVMHSLGGDRDAFCEIVTRYQTLLCSIAYSSVGDIKHSEDIAQEAFVEAWRKLDTLKDPAKLKSWLCGILRFKVSRFRRKEVGQPASDLNDVQEQTLADHAAPNMDQSAIEQQQQVLLWKALDGMDATYREPLVLFYREQRSIERVAAELELTEDTVKQRLSRGRKLLKQAMSVFVEDALGKTKPGVAFTTGVLAAISSISPPAKAAVLGAGAAKTSSMFSGATIIAILASTSGLISGFFGLRSSLDQSRTE